MAYWNLAAAALIVAAPTVGAIAQVPDDIARRIVNDPSAPDVSGAKATLVADAKVQGGNALRIQVSRKGANPWDSTVGGAIKKPIAKGDRLLLLFSARLEKGENGATSATLPYAAIQLGAAPYSTLISGPAVIGPDWKDFQIKGVAGQAYRAGELKVTIQLATAKQTVDFGPIVVLDQGQ